MLREMQDKIASLEARVAALESSKSNPPRKARSRKMTSRPTVEQLEALVTAYEAIDLGDGYTINKWRHLACELDPNIKAIEMDTCRLVALELAGWKVHWAQENK